MGSKINYPNISDVMGHTCPLLPRWSAHMQCLIVEVVGKEEIVLHEEYLSSQFYL